MKIFFSHSSSDKSLVREIIKNLPEHLCKWIDEKSLPAGEDITASLKEAITVLSDLVVLFISNNSISSDWVENEISWAIQVEKEVGHLIIIPVVIEKSALDNFKNKDFTNRKFLELSTTEEIDVKSLSKKIEKEIFNWLINRHDARVRVEELSDNNCEENISKHLTILELINSTLRNSECSSCGKVAYEKFINDISTYSKDATIDSIHYLINNDCLKVTKKKTLMGMTEQLSFTPTGKDVLNRNS